MLITNVKKKQLKRLHICILLNTLNSKAFLTIPNCLTDEGLLELHRNSATSRKTHAVTCSIILKCRSNTKKNYLIFFHKCI